MQKLVKILMISMVLTCSQFSFANSLDDYAKIKAAGHILKYELQAGCERSDSYETLLANSETTEMIGDSVIVIETAVSGCGKLKGFKTEFNFKSDRVLAVYSITQVL